MKSEIKLQLNYLPKVLNNFISLIFIFVFTNVFSQNKINYSPQISINYSKLIGSELCLSINKIRGSGSYTYDFKNIYIGFGAFFDNQKLKSDFIVGFSETIYFIQFDISSRISMNSDKYYLLSPGVGISYFGYMSLVYNYNINPLNSTNFSAHNLSLKIILTKWDG